MGKYNNIKVLKQTKARVSHICSNCGCVIRKEDFYFVEKLDDKFLHTLNRKKFCYGCHEKFGNKLLKKESFQRVGKSLSDF